MTPEEQRAIEEHCERIVRAFPEPQPPPGWSAPEVERERHARELGVSWCLACWADHAPDAPCQPRVEP